MILKNIFKTLCCLSLATLSYAINNDFNGECEDPAKAFAAHNNGNSDNLTECRVNDNGSLYCNKNLLFIEK